MIRSLSGKVTFATPPVFIVETQGVGYEINSTTLKTQVGATINCSVYTVVKEDALILYGFNNEQERGLFALLISVNGVGPKSALLIMGQLTTDQITQALNRADPKPFQEVKGIGKKVAERLVLDLAGSINRDSEQSDGSLELASALESLGYTRREYQPLLKQLPAGEIEDQLRWILSRFI